MLKLHFKLRFSFLWKEKLLKHSRTGFIMDPVLEGNPYCQVERTLRVLLCDFEFERYGMMRPRRPQHRMGLGSLFPLRVVSQALYSWLDIRNSLGHFRKHMHLVSPFAWISSPWFILDIPLELQVSSVLLHPLSHPQFQGVRNEVIQHTLSAGSKMVIS